MASKDIDHFTIRSRVTGSASGSTFLRRLTSPNKSEPPDQPTLGLHQIVEPPGPPQATIIFVHGLGGHPVKTWSFQRDPNFVRPLHTHTHTVCQVLLVLTSHYQFWPQEWLPYENGLMKVRICTFGYAADFATTKESNVTVLDFSKKLNLEILTAPVTDAPIIFVAHSMGGLVVKKARDLGA